MDFTLGKGFEIKGGVASVSAADLSDGQAFKNFEELKAEVEARGLWAPEGAGKISVEQAVETTEDLHQQLLASAEADVLHTNRVFKIINDTRRKNKRFDIIPAGQQRERLEDQFTYKGLKAAGQLFTTHDRPLMVVPALPDAITAKELVTAINKSSKRGIYAWAGRLPFLAKFPIDALTGYDEARAESGAMALVETGYDVTRRGTRDQQLRDLQAVQRETPAVETAPILTTATLGQRYAGQPDSRQDTYNREIEADPVRRGDFDYVVYAGVNVDGDASVDASRVQDRSVARRQVRLNV